MADFKITLTKEAEIGSTYVKSNNTSTYPENAAFFRVKVTATAQTPADMTAAVFAFQQSLADPYKATTEEQFMFVCSPFQLSIFPEDSSEETSILQFYRKDEVEVFFQSQKDANQFWTDLKAAVDNLVDRLERNDDSVLEPQTAVWVPDAPTTT